MNSLKEIARDCAPVEEVLVALYDAGASPIQAIKALHDGRGLSLIEGKSALHGSPAWSAEAEAAAALHDAIIKALKEEGL